MTIMATAAPQTATGTVCKQGYAWCENKDCTSWADEQDNVATIHDSATDRIDAEYHRPIQNRHEITVQATLLVRIDGTTRPSVYLDANDEGINLTPANARRLAASLLNHADEVDPPKAWHLAPLAASFPGGILPIVPGPTAGMTDVSALAPCGPCGTWTRHSGQYKASSRTGIVRLRRPTCHVCGHRAAKAVSVIVGQVAA